MRITHDAFVARLHAATGFEFHAVVLGRDDAGLFWCVAFEEGGVPRQADVTIGERDPYEEETCVFLAEKLREAEP